jgi:dihydroorotate dehydrogenase (fumarate)
MENMNTTYLGLNLKNPLIAGSCGMTNSISNIKELAKRGVGAVVVKSIFEEQIKSEAENIIKKNTTETSSYERPSETIWSKRIYDYEEAYSYMFDFAKRNTLGKYLYFLNEAKESVDIPVIASINCVSNQDWHSFAKKIEETGVDAIELNIYILPSDMRRSGEDNERIYFDIIKEVRSYVTLPLAIKIGFYFSSLAQSAVKLSQTGIKGMVLFNRPYNTDIDIHTMTLSHGSIYSSPEEYSRTLRWMSILSSQIECDLCASTGVHDHKVFIKLLLAGATTVQIASALYKRGLDVVPEILSKTSEWMEKNKFETTDSFRGLLSMKNLENPAAIERVQFMKLYSDIE